MFLRSIEANNFRNLEGKIVWGSGLNILHGNNGEGKSNWLEAIYLLAHAKSFRTGQLNDQSLVGRTRRQLRLRISQ